MDSSCILCAHHAERETYDKDGLRACEREGERKISVSTEKREREREREREG